MGLIQTILGFSILFILFIIGYILYKNYKTCGFDPICYWNALKQKWNDLKSGTISF